MHRVSTNLNFLLRCGNFRLFELTLPIGFAFLKFIGPLKNIPTKAFNLLVGKQSVLLGFSGIQRH